MLLIFSVVLVLGAVVFTLMIRPSDLPKPEPVLPWQHLEERKARIYENLRDLQFEFRVGKLSDEDYQRTKQSLQRELAQTMAEIDGMKAQAPAAPASTAASKKKAAAATAGQSTTPQKEFVCPHCKAKFDKPMKFCGECGKAMEE
jgi:hypothetical protein